MLAAPWYHHGTIIQVSEIDFRQRRGQLPILCCTRISVAQKQVVEPILGDNHQVATTGRAIGQGGGSDHPPQGCKPWDLCGFIGEELEIMRCKKCVTQNFRS